MVSVGEKVSYKTSGKGQGDEAIKPLLKCRKCIDKIETEGKSLTREKVWREPVYWPSGLRHKGGMNLT